MIKMNEKERFQCVINEIANLKSELFSETTLPYRQMGLAHDELLAIYAPIYGECVSSKPTEGKTQKQRFKETLLEIERLKDELFDEERIDGKVLFRMGLIAMELETVYTTLYHESYLKI